MGFRLVSARAISAISTAVLKHVFRRPAANFPGKVALYVDPHLIRDLAPNLAEGSIAVCGTNGKTTINNLIADVLEQSGKKVICNRTGANLDSGVATALLHGGRADWGVFECDELWLIKMLPGLQSKYVVLLNLFRDQLDRVGEIDRIQDSIAAALQKSPDSVLVYNADDPLCARIAESVPNRCITFGVDEDMRLAPNTIADAQMCQNCSGMLSYEYQQYGQLGAFSCTECDFARQPLDFAARDVALDATGMSFAVDWREERDTVKAPFQGAYMVYNLLATYAASRLLGCTYADFQAALDAFDPQNGRLQQFDVAGRRVLLNLAKNPTGFNQNMRLILQDAGPKAVAFFVNDKEGDGRDVSWIWDVDFEELVGEGAAADSWHTSTDPAASPLGSASSAGSGSGTSAGPDASGGPDASAGPGTSAGPDASTDLVVYAGGLRRNDLQVRLKYAGLDAGLVDDARDVLAKVAALPTDHTLYMIANYTALPALHADLTALAAAEQEGA